MITLITNKRFTKINFKDKKLILDTEKKQMSIYLKLNNEDDYIVFDQELISKGFVINVTKSSLCYKFGVIKSGFGNPLEYPVIIEKFNIEYLINPKSKYDVKIDLELGNNFDLLYHHLAYEIENFNIKTLLKNKLLLEIKMEDTVKKIVRQNIKSEENIENVYFSHYIILNNQLPNINRKILAYSDKEKETYLSILNNIKFEEFKREITDIANGLYIKLNPMEIKAITLIFKNICGIIVNTLNKKECGEMITVTDEEVKDLTLNIQNTMHNKVMNYMPCYTNNVSVDILECYSLINIHVIVLATLFKMSDIISLSLRCVTDNNKTLEKEI